MVREVPVAWRAAITAYTTYLRSGGSPDTTILTRRQQLNTLARSLGAGDPWGVTGPELVEWAGQRAWARETRKSNRTTLRSFYSWAVERGHVDESPALALPSVKPTPPAPRPTPDRILAAAMHDPAGGWRERLILRMACDLGMRRAEIAVGHSADLIEDLAGWSIVAHGKGGKDRVLPMPDGLAAQLRGLPAGWMFPGQVDGHLSPRWVGKLATRLLPGDWTLHSLRHRFANRAYEASGHDVFAVQELLGHASPATTRLYVERANRDRLRAIVVAAAA